MDKLKDKNPNFLTERERKASKLSINAIFLQIIPLIAQPNGLLIMWVTLKLVKNENILRYLNSPGIYFS